MGLLIFAGIVTIIAGFIFLSGEHTINKVNEAMTQFMSGTVARLDRFFLKNRVGTGICLLLVGIMCLFVAYWLKNIAPPNLRVF
jgi:hypothetical protein